MARSRYDIAKFNLKYSEIRVPSRGKILKKISGENEIVGAGHPVFLFGSTESERIIRSNLAGRDIVRVGMGDSASASFDAWPGMDFAAHGEDRCTRIGRHGLCGRRWAGPSSADCWYPLF